MQQVPSHLFIFLMPIISFSFTSSSSSSLHILSNLLNFSFFAIKIAISPSYSSFLHFCPNLKFSPPTPQILLKPMAPKTTTLSLVTHSTSLVGLGLFDSMMLHRSFIVLINTCLIMHNSDRLSFSSFFSFQFFL